MKSGQEYLNEARKWLMENRKDFQIDYQFEPSEVVYVAEFLRKVDKATEDYTDKNGSSYFSPSRSHITEKRTTQPEDKQRKNNKSGE